MVDRIETAFDSRGFDRFGLTEIVSFTSMQNIRSRRVMEKLGLHGDPADDFDHPNVPEDHPIRRPVIYRITASAFEGLTDPTQRS